MEFIVEDSGTGKKVLVKPMNDGLNFGLYQWVEREDGEDGWAERAKAFAQSVDHAVRIAVDYLMIQEDGEVVRTEVGEQMQQDVLKAVNRRLKQMTASVVKS